MPAKDKAKGPKAQHYVFPVPIYNQEVSVFTSEKEFVTFAKETGLDFNPKAIDGYALKGLDPDGLPIFILYIPFRDGKVNWEVVCHECYHMTTMIMDLVGIKADPDNDEPGAYLIGYMVSNIQHIFETEEAERKAKASAARKARAGS